MLFGGGTLRSAALQRWLLPQELYEVMVNYKYFGLTLCSLPPVNPQNGDIYIFDHLATPTYKNDGVNYTKRKERNSTQEDMRKILIDGVHVITGWNAISADDSNFRRRRYRLTVEGSSIFLVHYRNCYADEMKKMERRRSRTKSVSSSRNNSIAMTSDSSPYDLDAASMDMINWMDDTSDDVSFRTMLSEFLGDDTGIDGHSSTTPSPPVLPPVPSIPTASPMDFQPSSHLNAYLAPAPLLTPISAAPSQAPGPIAVLDFSPSWDHIAGGAKVLIILSSAIPESYQRDMKVYFGSQGVTGTMISPTVLRCEAPSVSTTCSCSISIQGRDMAITCQGSFEYRQLPVTTPPATSTTTTPITEDINTSKRRVSEPLPMLDTHHHKIRLVEKLTCVDDATPHSERSHDEDWLDDKALALLPFGDLEKLMDKFLLRVVKQLVQMVTLDDDLKAELDTLDASGYSLMHYCCLFNLPGLVLKLLEHGVDVMQRSKAGETPLHLAIHANHLSVVEVLMAAGSDPYAKDLRNITPLDLCLQENRVAMYEYISSRATTPRVGDTNIHQDTSAAMETSGTNDNSQKVSLLQGALSSLSLTDKCALSLSFSNVNTADNTLESAIAASPRADEVQSVLSETDKESLDVAMSMMGPTELTAVEQEVKLIQNNVRAWLLRKNYTNLREAAKILQGAWREKRNSHRLTGQRFSSDQKRPSTSYDRRQVDAAATLQAATRGMLARKEFQRVKRQAMASLVIQKSLLMWWVHNKQSTTLYVDQKRTEDFMHAAGHSNSESTVMRMLEETPEIKDARDEYGDTALLKASRAGHMSIAKLLVEVGADINAKDVVGKTPLLWASRQGHSAIVTYLVRRGADVNAIDQDGTTPLMWACRGGHYSIAKIIMDEGADVNAVDQNGDTAFKWACAHGHKSITNLLVEMEADKNDQKQRARSTSAPSTSSAAVHVIKFRDVTISGSILTTLFSSVYRGEYRGTDVAIKMLRGDGGNLQMQEIEILSNLRHPRILSLLGVIWDLDKRYEAATGLVTEFMPRGSLYNVLHLDTTPPEHRLSTLSSRLRVLRDVADGMRFLHMCDVIHRDLKSPNVLLDEDGRAKICDFGISKQLSTNTTHATGGATTPAWQAPESLLDESDTVRQSCDVYSFGVILWEMLTNSVPWKGVDPLKIPLRLSRGESLSLSSNLVHDTPPELHMMLEECLQRNPDLRPTFAHILQCLCDLLPTCLKKEGRAPCPNVFLCPISYEIMKDPVMCSDGHTYDRVNIERWLLQSDTSPVTNVALEDKTLRPNIALRGLIGEFRAANPEL